MSYSLKRGIEFDAYMLIMYSVCLLNAYTMRQTGAPLMAWIFLFLFTGLFAAAFLIGKKTAYIDIQNDIIKLSRVPLIKISSFSIQELKEIRYKRVWGTHCIRFERIDENHYDIQFAFWSRVKVEGIVKDMNALLNQQSEKSGLQA